jgi:hypothetical protein
MHLYEMTIIVETRLEDVKQQQKRMQRIDEHPETIRKSNPLLPVLIFIAVGIWLGIGGS